METIVFYSLAIPVLGLALIVVTTRNMLRAVVALFLALTGTGCMYFLMRAPVIAALQLMVYAGGIAVLLAFAVMLIRRLTGEHVRHTTGLRWPAMTVAAAFAVLVLAILLGQVDVLDHSVATAEPSAALEFATRLVDTRAPTEIDPKEDFSPLMVREYLLPFEIASVLLLVAIVGAVLIGHPPGLRHPDEGEATGPPSEAAPEEGGGEHHGDE